MAPPVTSTPVRRAGSQPRHEPSAPSPDSPVADAAQPPDVSFYPPEDGPPPYSVASGGDASMRADGSTTGLVWESRPGPEIRDAGLTMAELATLLRGGEDRERDRRRPKPDRLWTKVLGTAGCAVLVLFVIIVTLIVVLMVKKENPVCNLSVPHSEALTVNILGEIQLARQQAMRDHKDLQRRLAEIYSRHTESMTGSLSREIILAKQNITADFYKLERKFNLIFKKMSALQKDLDAKDVGSSQHSPNSASVIFSTLIVIYLLSFLVAY